MTNHSPFTELRFWEWVTTGRLTPELYQALADVSKDPHKQAEYALLGACVKDHALKERLADRLLSISFGVHNPSTQQRVLAGRANYRSFYGRLCEGLHQYLLDQQQLSEQRALRLRAGIRYAKLPFRLRKLPVFVTEERLDDEVCKASISQHRSVYKLQVSIDDTGQPLTLFGKLLGSAGEYARLDALHRHLGNRIPFLDPLVASDPFNRIIVTPYHQGVSLHDSLHPARPSSCQLSKEEIITLLESCANAVLTYACPPSDFRLEKVSTTLYRLGGHSRREDGSDLLGRASDRSSFLGHLTFEFLASLNLNYRSARSRERNDPSLTHRLSQQPAFLHFIRTLDDTLCARLDAQPLVFSHGDLHQRNIRVTQKSADTAYDPEIVIVDWERAGLRPITYDLSMAIADKGLTHTEERILVKTVLEQAGRKGHYIREEDMNGMIIAQGLAAAGVCAFRAQQRTSPEDRARQLEKASSVYTSVISRIGRGSALHYALEAAVKDSEFPLHDMNEGIEVDVRPAPHTSYTDEQGRTLARLMSRRPPVDSLRAGIRSALTTASSVVFGTVMTVLSLQAAALLAHDRRIQEERIQYGKEHTCEIQKERTRSQEDSLAHASAPYTNVAVEELAAVQYAGGNTELSVQELQHLAWRLSLAKHSFCADDLTTDQGLDALAAVFSSESVLKRWKPPQTRCCDTFWHYQSRLPEQQRHRTLDAYRYILQHSPSRYIR